MADRRQLAGLLARRDRRPEILRFVALYRRLVSPALPVCGIYSTARTIAIVGNKNRATDKKE